MFFKAIDVQVLGQMKQNAQLEVTNEIPRVQSLFLKQKEFQRVLGKERNNDR